MKKIILISILIANFINAQENRGYYNSKFFTSFETLINTPFFYNVYGTDYLKTYNHQLESVRNKLNYGFRTSVGIILKRNVAFVLEFGVDRAKCYTSRSMTVETKFMEDKLGFDVYNRYYYDLRIEALNANSIYLMPKIEITNKKGLLPLGLTHTIGIGYCKTKIQNKDYAAMAVASEASIYDSLTGYHNTEDGSYAPVISDFSDKLFEYKNQIPLTSIQLMYALTIKTAISRKIFLNYGLRYNFNIPNFFQKRSDYVKFNDGYYLSSANFAYYISRQKVFNFMNFTVGLTYAL